MNTVNSHIYCHDHLITCLNSIACEREVSVYFCGGVVRDWLLGEVSADFDITVSNKSLEFSKDLSVLLQATLVPLSEKEGISRVVWNDVVVDVSAFRDSAGTIEEDLCRRDFSINAMAVSLADFEEGRLAFENVIDPLNGRSDLEQGVIRAVSEDAFSSDPLRLLRAYRFAARLGFFIEPKTLGMIKKNTFLVSNVAGERIAVELEKIVEVRHSCDTFRNMAESGLLWELFPELVKGVGISQPASHHLDVFDHCLETLCQMEKLIDNFQEYFDKFNTEIAQYLTGKKIIFRLKFAALLHDVGKAAVAGFRNGRITFYDHDGVGAKILEDVADRLKWSNDDGKIISLLVKLHMRPFHLNNAKKKTGVKPKAYLKLVKAVGDELIGLFLLAMADSLAGSGHGKPPDMEKEIASLFAESYTMNMDVIKPVLNSPLLNGNDLIEEFHLKPGPVFGIIFSELEQVRVANPNLNREEAFEWVREYLKRN